MGITRFSVRVEKGLLFVCCLVVFLVRQDGSPGIGPILAAVICSGLLSLVEKPAIRTLLTAGFGMLCIAVPALTFFLPLIAYDMPCQPYQAFNLVGLVPLALFLEGECMQERLFVLILVVLSLLLRVRIEELTRLKRTHVQLKDTAREYAEKLKTRNRELVEKQDAELQVATLNERNRIAREIHDNVGHLLSSALLQTGALLVTRAGARDERGQDAPGSPEDGMAGVDHVAQKDHAARMDVKGREELVILKDTLGLAMDSIRTSVHNLYDESVDLPAQLWALARDCRGCEMTVDCQLAEEPGRKTKLAFIAICREAQANIMRHSNATHGRMVLREHPAFYQLVVRDNGKVGKIRLDEGMGLQGMEERVRALGGHFHIATEQGFEIFVTIPKDRQA